MKPTDEELEAMAVWAENHDMRATGNKIAAMLRACKGRVKAAQIETLKQKISFAVYQDDYGSFEKGQAAMADLGRSFIEAFGTDLAPLEPAPDHAECMHPFCGDRCGEHLKKGQTNG